MYAVIRDPDEAENLYRKTLTEKERMMMEDSMLGMDETMCECIFCSFSLGARAVTFQNKSALIIVVE